MPSDWAERPGVEGMGGDLVGVIALRAPDVELVLEPPREPRRRFLRFPALSCSSPSLLVASALSAAGFPDSGFSAFSGFSWPVGLGSAFFPGFSDFGAGGSVGLDNLSASFLPAPLSAASVGLDRRSARDLRGSGGCASPIGPFRPPWIGCGS